MSLVVRRLSRPKLTSERKFKIRKEDFLYVDCDKHGRGVAAIVCRHLCNEKITSIGFIENSSEPGDKQDWCLECEEYSIEQGEMTDAFNEFNDMAPSKTDKRLIFLLE